MIGKTLPLSSEWKEVSPGHFRRPMGENEQLIHFIGSRAHAAKLEQWTVSATAKFKLTTATRPSSWPTSDADLLRAAWRGLRHRHPSVACWVTSEKELDYTVPDEATLTAWAEETFFVVEDPKASASTVIASFVPRPVATLHYLAAQSQIIISTAHWRTDGYGALHLVDEFFAALESVTSGRQAEEETSTSASTTTTTSRLMPSLEWALQLPAAASTQVVAAAKTYLATGASLPGTAGIAADPKTAVRPRGTQHVELALTVSETESVQRVCKQQGVCIYAMVHAAVRAAVYAKAPAQDSSRHFTSTIRLNIRPHLPQPYDTAAGASGLYTGGYLIASQPGDSFLTSAKAYQKEYDQGTSSEFLESRREYARLTLAHLQTITGPPPSVSNVDVSFVQDVDAMVTPVRKSELCTIEILDLGLGVSTLTRQLYCFYWLFRGALKLQLWYNEAFYEESMASDVLQTIRDELVSVS